MCVCALFLIDFVVKTSDCYIFSSGLLTSLLDTLFVRQKSWASLEQKQLGYVLRMSFILGGAAGIATAFRAPVGAVLHHEASDE